MGIDRPDTLGAQWMGQEIGNFRVGQQELVFRKRRHHIAQTFGRLTGRFQKTQPGLVGR